MKKEITLLCIKNIYKGKHLVFEEGNRYLVVTNHPNLVSLVGEDGKKLHLSKTKDHLNLDYLWNYFYIIDKAKLKKLETKSK